MLIYDADGNGQVARRITRIDNDVDGDAHGAVHAKHNTSLTPPTTPRSDVALCTLASAIRGVR